MIVHIADDLRYMVDLLAFKEDGFSQFKFQDIVRYAVFLGSLEKRFQKMFVCKRCV